LAGEDTATTTINARGSFEVKLDPQSQDQADGSTLARYSLDKTFHGDLEATSRGEMLSAGGAVAGSGAYVAVERVTGTLQGKNGSFALVHRGIRSASGQELLITVVPDSGSGDLTGIRGTLQIVIADGKHSYDLEYSLD